MGGLVAAEIALLPPDPPIPGRTFRHRILGTLNFDVPFLGMHPGVISAGLGSLFNPAPDPTESGAASPVSTASESSSSIFNNPADPNYNPRFTNDVVLPVRTGWKNAFHFLNKHSSNFREATTNLVKSHLEFGGAMADYSGLRGRYMKIRALEDSKGEVRRNLLKEDSTPPRVRFVNYYTASTGRPKKEKSKSRSRSRSRGRSNSPDGKVETSHDTSLGVGRRTSRGRSRSPRISIDEVEGDHLVHKGDVETEPEHEHEHDHDHLSPLNEAEPMPMTSEEESNGESDVEPEAGPKAKPAAEADVDSDAEALSPVDTRDSNSSLTAAAVDNILPAHHHTQLPNLPPIPHAPMEPMALNLSLYPDKDAQKIATKDHERQVKAWKTALKDREAAIRDREKLEAKMRKSAAKEILKKMKEDEKKVAKERKENELKEKGKENKKVVEPSTESEINAGTDSIVTTEQVPAQTISRTPTATLSRTDTMASSQPLSTQTSRSTKPAKPKKDRKFCVLPGKINGERDPAWIRIFMKDMDEVSAHCGLFFMGETYERLIGDVGARIEDWVREEMTRKVVEGLE